MHFGKPEVLAPYKAYEAGCLSLRLYLFIFQSMAACFSSLQYFHMASEIRLKAHDSVFINASKIVIILCLLKDIVSFALISK